MTDRERLEALIRENIGAFTDALIAAGVSPPPHLPPTPPPPTWKPSPEAWEMMFRWLVSPALSDDFLRRLYAQLHRDRVAAMATLYIANGEEIVRLKGSHVASRTAILSLADDGTGRTPAALPHPPPGGPER